MFIGIFIIVLIGYFALNYYIIRRGYKFLPEYKTFKIFYLLITIFFALAFIVGKIVEHHWFSGLSVILIWIGAIWLGALLYLSLCLMIIDFIGYILKVSPELRKKVVERLTSVKYPMVVIILILTSIILYNGYKNALSPSTTYIEVNIDKKTTLDSLNLVAVSDLHLGAIMNRSRLETIVSKINACKPDAVVLVGDIVDDNLEPVIRENTGYLLSTIEALYGVYAVTGNHEFYGDVDAITQYLRSNRVKVLRDSVAQIFSDIYLIGREDTQYEMDTSEQRKSLNTLLDGIDRKSPLILLDHKPDNLDQARANGIDLQISGHTHHGQLWPLNLITEMLYEKSWGYMRKGNTHYYISCGIGTWGPPMRIGNQPEIVNIMLRFGQYDRIAPDRNIK